jgi:sugar phosphate isomerase/epimerase
MEMRPFLVRATARTLARDLPFCREHGLLPEVYLPAEALDGGMDQALPLLLAWREEGRDLTFHGPFKHLSPGASDPLVQEACRFRCAQALEAAEKVQPLHLLFHHGYDGRRYEWREEEWLSASVRLWAPLLEGAARIGIKVVFENVFDESPKALLALRDRLGKGAAGFCLDTGHHLLFARTPLEDWLAAFGSDLREMHLHDNFMVSDLHLPVGRGRFDFPSLFRHLHRHGHLPLMVLEHHDPADALPSREECRRLMARAAREGGA